MPRGARQPPASATQPRRLSGRRGLQAALLTVAEGLVRVNLDTNFPRPLCYLRICLIFAEKTGRISPTRIPPSSDERPHAQAATADARSRPYTPGFNGNHPKPDLPR